MHRLSKNIILSLFALCVWVCMSAVPLVAQATPFDTTATLNLETPQLSSITTESAKYAFDGTRELSYESYKVTLEAGQAYDFFARGQSTAISMYLYKNDGTRVVGPVTLSRPYNMDPNIISMSYTPAESSEYVLVISNYYSAGTSSYSYGGYLVVAQKDGFGTVYGSVTDVNGSPLLNRAFGIGDYRGQVGGVASENINGTITFSQVPNGLYTLWVPRSAPDGGAAWIGAVSGSYLGATGNACEATWVSVSAGVPTLINYDLRDMPEVSGRVLNPDGTPFEGKLGLLQFMGYNESAMCLAKDGYFSMRVPVDRGFSYILRAQMPPGVVIQYPNETSVRIPVAVKSHKDVGVWTLPHLDNKITIAPRTHEGAPPVPGTIVVSRYEFGRYIESSYHAYDGTNPVSIEVRDGQYQVRFGTSALVDGNASTIQSRDAYYPVELGPDHAGLMQFSGGNSFRVEIPLPDFGTIAGTIDFPRNYYPRLSEIKLLRWTGSGWDDYVARWIDDPLSFRYTNVAPGTYTIRYTASETRAVYLGGTSDPAKAQRIEVAEGQEYLNLTLQLPDPAGLIVGSVMNAGAQPVVGALVEAYSYVGSSDTMSLVATAAAGADGSYSLRVPSPGNCSVRASYKGLTTDYFIYQDPYWGDPTLEFWLGRYQAQGCDFVLENPGRIAGGVQNVLTQPLAATVTLLTYNPITDDWEYEDDTFTNREGQYCFPTAGAGEHVVLADGPDGYGSRFYGDASELYQATTIDLSVAHEINDRDITLQRSAELRGRLAGPKNEPIANCVVAACALSDSAIQDSYIALTASDGTWKLANIPEGAYEIVALPADSWVSQSKEYTLKGDSIELSDTGVFDTGTLVLPRSGVLRGVASDSDGRPLAGVTVSVFGSASDGDLYDETTTRADGSYRFETLEPADYAVVFRPTDSSGLAPITDLGISGATYLEGAIDTYANVSVVAQSVTYCDQTLVAKATVSGTVALSYSESVHLTLEQQAASGEWISVDSTTVASAAPGNYPFIFNKLTSGSYRVRMSGVGNKPDSYMPSTFDESAAQIVTVGAGGSGTVTGVRPVGAQLTVNVSAPASRPVWPGSYDLYVMLEKLDAKTGEWRYVDEAYPQRGDYEYIHFGPATFTALSPGKYRVYVDHYDDPMRYQPSYSGNTVYPHKAQMIEITSDTGGTTTAVELVPTNYAVEVKCWPFESLGFYYANADGYLNLPDMTFDSEGAVLEGYYTDWSYTQRWDPATKVPLGGLTLWAKFVESSYDVTIIRNNGVADEVVEIPWDGYLYPFDPKRPGYTFGGWAVTEYSGWIWSPSERVYEDMTLEAIWIPLTHQVSFVDGDKILATRLVPHGGSASLPETPVKDGYTFAGYNISTRNITADTTVQALWVADGSPSQHQLFLDASAGEISGAYTQFYDTAQELVLPVAEKQGYEFLGWYTASAGGQRVVSGSPAPAGDLTLVAHYRARRFTVTLDTNGGVALEPLQVACGALLPDDVIPVRTGYRFRGWYTDSTLKTPWGMYSHRMGAAPMMLYAKWDKGRYNVIFNGGSESVTQVNRAYFGDQIVAPPAPYRPDYVFAGWYKDQALTSPIDFTSAPMAANDVEYYAKWTAKHTVTFIDDENVFARKECVEGDGVIFPAAPTRSNCEFMGWYSDPVGGVKVSTLSNVLSDVSVYARFKSKVAFIKAISSSFGKWSAAFAKTRYSYALALSRRTSEVRVEAKKADIGSKVYWSMNGSTWTKGSAKIARPRSGSSVTVYFKCVSESGTVKKIYKVTVRRP